MVELSGIDMIPLIREIGEKLSGAYVNNVFSAGTNQIVRFRRPEGDDRLLVISPGHGAWVSEKVAARTETTEFTSRLRAEVERLRFLAASQRGLDRVFDFELEGPEENRHLILELMPPGNILVTDAGGKIVLLLREVRSRSRQQRRGDRYSPPPQSRLSPAEVDPESLRKVMAGEKTLGGALGRRLAIPKKYVKETLARLQLDESAPVTEALPEAERIAEVIAGIVREAKASPSPCLAALGEGGEEEVVFAVNPRGFKIVRSSPSMCALCDDLFAEAVLHESAAGPTPEEVWQKEREITVKRLKEREEEALEEAKRLRTAAGTARDSESLAAALKILTDTGHGGPGGRPQPTSREAVASALFALAKESEAKARDARDASEALLRKRGPKVQAGEKHGGGELRRKRGEWYERFRWFFTSGRKLAIGGRDAQSNTLLIRRHLEPGDTVYHADLFGSPFFVLKGGKTQTEEEVKEVAQATVAFSSAWKTGLGAADAYWVRPDQVATAAPSGEYLPRGGFAIGGKKNFVTKNLVETAVGLDRDGRLAAGPEAALAKNCPTYVVLRPHREKASDTAKKVLRDLAAASDSDRGPPILLDDVLRVLPTGGGKVVRRVSSRGESREAGGPTNNSLR